MLCGGGARARLHRRRPNATTQHARVVVAVPIIHLGLLDGGGGVDPTYDYL